MSPVKNIQRIITTVLITAVLGLFFTGAHAGSFAPGTTAAFYGKNKKQGLQQQLHKSSPIAFFHKSSVRRTRYRAGLVPLLSANITLAEHSVPSPQPYSGQESFQYSIFHAPTLRGPPCA